MKQPFAIILAGGQATRMGGGDKATLPLGNRTVLHEVIDRIDPQVARVALNANGDATRFDEYALPVMPDTISGFVGPLAGVLTGMDWAAENGADHVVSVAADTPFFPCDLVPQLMLASEGSRSELALAATPDGWQPTFGLWPVRLRDDLRSALNAGLRKVLAWTDQHDAARADFPVPQTHPFFNINTPEDLSMAQEMVAKL